MIKHRHTIILVEDEPAVLSVMQRVLEKVGYGVVPFADPRDAAAHLRSLDDACLLLTDVVMPGMSGFDLCGIARARFPGLPVIFTSGYPLENLPGDPGALPENTRLLHKPFGLELMRNTIEELLLENAREHLTRAG